MEPAQDTPTVPRRIPTTKEHKQEVVAIAGLAHDTYSVVKGSLLVPTGVLLKLNRETDQNRVVELLTASGYTAAVIASGRVAVTGVIDRLEMLRAERDRLNAEIAAEEQRERERTAADAA